MLKVSRLALFFVPLVLTACGGGPTALEFERAAVRGQVTFQGKPLETGLIKFLPDTPMIEGQVAGRPAFANIKDGAYSIPADKGATVGPNRVEILSYRKTGKKTQMEDTMVEEEVQFLPERFNVESTLAAEIQAGENEKNFDLQ